MTAPPLCSYDRLYPELLRLLTPNGVQASDFDLFKGAVFGRDSLYVGLDLVDFLPSVARNVLLSLAALQGAVSDPDTTQEEPGRIHHEYRSRFIGSEEVPRAVRKVMANLQAEWKLPPGDDLVIYSTVDATPLWLILLDRYVTRWGNDILHARIVQRNGMLVTVSTVRKRSLAWLVRRIGASELGLVEFRRTNPNAHTWEVMRDGRTACIHEDGRLANSDAPIASLEVQALAYEALLAHGFTQDAERLRLVTMDWFYLPSRGYFAMAVDRDEHGKPRRVKTASSNQVELLATGFFEGLTNGNVYARAIIEQMTSEQFLTPVGIRMRGLKYAGLVPYWDYQGTCVSWYNVTNRLAVGLRRAGYVSLARGFEKLMVSGVNSTGACVEFSYVDAHGAVLLDPLSAGPTLPVLAATNVPEHTQAWTVSAMLRILHDWGRDDPRTRSSPFDRSSFGDTRLDPDLPQLHYRIDVEAGRRAEANFAASHS